MKQQNKQILFFLSVKGSSEIRHSLSDMDAPRSLNSDISYFGVGGKQAIFFVGTSTRVSTAAFDCLKKMSTIISVV